MTAYVLVAAWVFGSIPLGIILGRGIRLADERESRLPARLDPRAGQYATRAANAKFTGLLFAVAVVGLVFAQQMPGGLS